jgi:hypothetical protein
VKGRDRNKLCPVCHRKAKRCKAGGRHDQYVLPAATSANSSVSVRIPTSERPRRTVKPSALFALALALGAGCREVDPRKAAIVDDEIATIGSEAKTPGPRSKEHIARIESSVQALKKNVRELAK